jgi:hypothetical protein
MRKSSPAAVVCAVTLLAGCSDIPLGAEPNVKPSGQEKLGPIAIAPIETITLSSGEQGEFKWKSEDVFVRGRSTKTADGKDLHLDFDQSVATALTKTGSYDKVEIGPVGLEQSWKDHHLWNLSVTLENVRIRREHPWYHYANIVNYALWIWPAWFIAGHEDTLELDAHVTVTSGESGRPILEDKLVPVKSKPGAFDELDRTLHLLGPFSDDDAEGSRAIASMLLPSAWQELGQAVAAELEKDLRAAIADAKEKKIEIHRKTLLLSVGVTRYAQAKAFPPDPARYATEDASAVADALAPWGSIPSVHGITLTDESATLAAVRDQIAQHLGRARDGDDVVFYFAGHGTRTKNGEPAILLHDANDATNAGLLTLKELSALLKPIKGRKLVLLDTAFDGLGRSVKRGIAPAVDTDLQPFSDKSSSIAVLAAASGGEPAMSQKYLAHGLFTYHLLRILSGKVDDRAEKVAASELLKLVGDPVMADSARFGVLQTPRGSVSAPFLFELTTK